MEKLSIGRQRGRLRRARERGWLELRGADGIEALTAHGAWCWRLRLPFVWCERNSPGSRYWLVRLDLFTTGKRLTEQGVAALEGIGPWRAAVSPHDGVWRHVLWRDLPRLAGRVVRTVVKPENCEAVAPRRIEVQRHGPAKVIQFENPRAGCGTDCQPAAG